jgi:hypothetical protein
MSLTVIFLVDSLLFPIDQRWDLTIIIIWSGSDDDISKLDPVNGDINNGEQPSPGLAEW